MTTNVLNDVIDLEKAIEIERREIETSYAVLTENYRAARTITDKVLRSLKNNIKDQQITCPKCEGSGYV